MDGSGIDSGGVGADAEKTEKAARFR